MPVSPDSNPSMQDREYRLQGKRNQIDAGKRLNAGLRRVIEENRAAVQYDLAAARSRDRAVIELMRSLIESAQLQRLRNAVDLPDHLAEIMLSRDELARLRAVKARQARDGAIDGGSERDVRGAVNAAAQSLIGKGVAIGSSIDAHSKRSDLGSTYVTDFIGADNAFATQYVEGKLEEWLTGLVGDRAVNLQKNVRGVVSTTDTLATLVQLTGKLPPSATGAIGYVVHPVSGVVTLIEDAVSQFGDIGNFQKAASHASTGIVIPLTKLAEPLGHLMVIGLKYKKIDEMHALHQRRRGCGAAYEIADKWEQGIFNTVAKGNYVYLLVTALRDLWSAVRAIKGGAASEAGLAEKLWVAAQIGPSGDRGDCDNALVILATLFGAGNAPKGVVKAVAAIVSPRESGIQKIKSLI